MWPKTSYPSEFPRNTRITPSPSPEFDPTKRAPTNIRGASHGTAIRKRAAPQNMGRSFSRDDAEDLTVLAALGGGDVFFIFRLAFDATDGEGRGTQTIARDKATAHLTDTVRLGVNGAEGVINGVESGVLLVGMAPPSEKSRTPRHGARLFKG